MDNQWDTSATPGRRMNRRDVLYVGSLGLGGLTMSDLLRARAAAVPTNACRDTSVVLLFLPGGPSHIDMYDPKPDAPAEVRGQYGAIETAVSGIRISEMMPEQAKIMDKVAVVRTFSHHDGNHGSAVHWVATGVLHPPADLGAPQIAPAPGSVVAKVRGMRDGALPYVSLARMPTGDGPAYLGVGCAPFEVTAENQRMLGLPTEIDLGRLRGRRELRQAIDGLRQNYHSQVLQGMDQFQREAIDLVTGHQIRDALDLTKEDPRIVDRYGSGLGEQMLLARRLCEANVSFVTICWGGGSRFGWDNHSRVFPFLSAHLPQLDHAVATFVSDVANCGLSERILLVVMGEMGRTPKVNETAGRHHWPQVMFVILAGGGLKMGQVIGKTSAHADTIVTRPFHAQDLLATIYHVLGISPELVFADSTGRPLPILSEGNLIRELV